MPKISWLKKAIPQSLRSQTSSNLSDITNGRDLDTSTSRSHNHDTPDTLEHDASRLIPDGDRSDQERTRRTRTSRESARPTSSTIRFQHDRQPSISRQKAAVRLLGQEQAAAPPDMTRCKAGQAFCTLIVTYHQNKEARIVVARIEDALVEYEEATAFEELSEIATDQLIKHIGRPAEAFYLKVGRFRLVRRDSNKVASRGILESKREWDEYLPWKIPEFLGQNRNVPFHIEIEWEYSSLQIEQVPGQSYATTIGTAIEGKIQKNWEGRKYVPQKDLDKIMTEDAITKLIHEDESLYDAKSLTLTGGTKPDAVNFINEIWLWGARLLALCVYAEIPLSCLYHMWLNGLRDTDLPLTENDCPDDFYRRKFDIAVLISGGFAAHTFAPNEKGKLEHRQLKPGALVPILFDKADPEHILGRGSFGQVYKVHIDRDHHSFSALEEEAFAFKIFYDARNTRKNVEEESSTLAILAEVPHPNITTHLASWIQNGICYMLFRCADCNLRTYMSRESPAWTKSTMLAHISQMRGLADGLRHIHNLGPSNLEPDRVDEKAKPGERRPSQTCYHHDLKPANILVTLNPDTEHLLFSISDFGSAKIGQLLSGSIQPSPFTKNLSPGDAVYGAPDAVLEGRTSRPYDMWSVGCILLELLTWIVDPKDNVERFAEKRMEIPDIRGNQDPAFWYENADGRVALKPAVVQHLKDLKEHCKGKGVFPQLVRIVGKLLSILPGDRPESFRLFNDLDAIMTEVQFDLKNENFYINKQNESFYINSMPTEVRIAAPPSSVGDLSRRPSIDDRAIIARYGYGENLSPEPRASRRSTVSTVDSPVRQRRTSVHARHQSTPEAHANPPFPAPLDIDLRAAPSGPTNEDEIPITPSISLSDYGNGLASNEDLLHMGRGDESLPPYGSHYGNFAPGLQRTISSDSQDLISD